MIEALKSLASLIDHVVNALPERLRPTVLLSLIFVVIGVFVGGWLVREHDEALAVFVGVPILGLGILGLLISLIRTFREPRPVSLSGEEDETAAVVLLKPGYKVLHGHRLLGIELQADAIHAGVLEVRADDPTVFPQEVETLFEEQKALPRLDAEAYYEEFVNAIVAMLRRARACDGIGLAIPGLVNPGNDRIIKAPEYFPESEKIVDELASRLSENALVCGALRVRAGDSAKRDIAAHFLIDNDVRCQTRDLLRTKLHSNDWRNYAYLFVGKKGAAVGLVLNRRVYYGSRLRAGEFGHTTVHLNRQLEESVLSGSDDEALTTSAARTAPRCKCEKQGVHWEALVTEQALNDLTEHLAPGQRAPIASLLESGGIAGLARSEEEAAAYEIVLATYANYLGIGIANLVNIFDLDHLVLGGRVIRDFWRIRDLKFREAVRDAVDRYSFHDGPDADFYDTAEVEGWRGAALLFRDPDFHLALEPTPSAFTRTAELSGATAG